MSRKKQIKKLRKQVDNLSLEVETLTATLQMSVDRQNDTVKVCNLAKTNALDCIADIKAFLDQQ